VENDMDKYRTNKAAAVISALLLLSMQSLQSVSAPADTDSQDEDSRGVFMSRTIHSIVATGLNDHLGVPPYDLGPPFGTFNFAMLGVYNKDGPTPLPITPDTPDSAILATTVHPNFLVIDHKTQADVNPAWLNIPLRDVPINTDFGSVYTLSGPGLLGVRAAGPQDVAQAEPADPITLGQWKKGRGILKVICHSETSARLKLRVQSLLPHRMYGIGATLGGFHEVPVDQQILQPFTIGGVPHLLVTDEHGDGELDRDISFCPLDPNSTDRTVLVINLLYYSRHQNYGAVPEPVLVNGLWLGLVTHNHLQFPINVTPAQ
jgi:hypothetical protein